jgi:hypothetical protein
MQELISRLTIPLSHLPNRRRDRVGPSLWSTRLGLDGDIAEERIPGRCPWAFADAADEGWPE